MSVKQFFLATSAIAIMLPVAAIAQTATPTATAAIPAPAVHPAIAAAPATATAVAPAPAPADAPVPTPAAAPAIVSGDPNAPVTHAEFSEMLKAALLKDPEIIVEAVKGIHKKQEAETSKEIEKAIEKNHDELFKDTTSPSIGDAKTADVTLIEFFDYHCGYCKRMLPAIIQLHKEDPKVHIIFREFPILSEDSSTASIAALAVNKLYPGKYFEFHTVLMNTNAQFNDKSLSAVAKKLDMDWKKIKKEMEKPEFKAILDKNHALAEELGVRGTPALVIGNQMLPGAVPYEDLKKMVADARSGKNAATDAKPEASHQAPTPPTN